MRWEAIKQAWALARESFPSVKRLYVELPHRFRDSGECPVFDLEKADEPIGKIAYKTTCIDGNPLIFMNLHGKEKSASVTRVPSIEFPVPAAPLQKVAYLDAKSVMAQYQDPGDLAEQVAYLAMGHETGPLHNVKTAALTERDLKTWLLDAGFQPGILPHAVKALGRMGIDIVKSEDYNLREAKHKKRRFENYQKVRVVDPRSREYQEGAQILDHKRDKENNDWYQVLVDASSIPTWFHESQIQANDVGSVSEISSIDQEPAENG